MRVSAMIVVVVVVVVGVCNHPDWMMHLHEGKCLEKLVQKDFLFHGVNL